MNSFLRILWLLPLFTFSVHAIDYYVAPAPAGNDNNAGTVNAPFATIAKARDVVRTVNTNMTADINVYLRGGWHKQTATLAFTQADGGTNNKNIIYQAYPGEAAVISGGQRITGWTIDNSTRNIWKATATGLNFRQFFVNCQWAQRAHSGAALPGGVQTSTGYTTTDNTMQNWGNKSDIEMVYNGSPAAVAWSAPRIAVANISGTTITMGSRYPAFYSAPWYDKVAVPNDVENAYELLDQPGEWYLNRTTGIVYYIPRPGEDMATAVAIAPILESLVSGSGTSGAPLKNMQFKNITFAHATWLWPNTNGSYPDYQGCYGLHIQALRTPGNVIFQFSQNLRFERCVFKHLGASGLDLNNGCKNNVIIGCAVSEIAANAVQLGNLTSNAAAASQDDSNQVLNCYIHHGGLMYAGGEGVMAAYTKNTLISHNEVANFSHTGINSGWGWGTAGYLNNIDITYNDVHDCNQLLTDGGCIYSLSGQPNSSWDHNFVHDTWGHNFYLDQGTAGIVVNNNVSIAWNDWVNTNNQAGGGGQSIPITDNFSNTSTTDFMGYQTTSNNTVVTDGNWPAAARTIMDQSGLEPAYKDVKNMKCACSIVSLNTTTKPIIVSATAISPTKVKVVYSGVVDPVSATALSNYQINGITISSAATVTSELNAIILTVSTMTTATAYTLTVSNVNDRNTPANTIVANSTVPIVGLGIGMVGWWKFDETSGTTALDASGHNNNGVMTGGTRTAYGKIGGALQFNGTGDKVVIPTTALGACTGDYSIACWFNNTNRDRWQTVFRSTANKCHLTIWVNNSDFGMGGTSSNIGLSNAPYSGGWSLNRWWHVVLIKKGTRVLEYQDGKLVAQLSGAGTQTAEELTLGYYTNAGFGGMMDDVRLYNRAINDDEIAMLFAGSDTTSLPTVGLLKPLTITSVKRVPDIISIFTLKGALVHQQSGIDNKTRMQAVPISNGIYVIKELYGTESVVRKIIIQRNNKLTLSHIVNGR